MDVTRIPTRPGEREAVFAAITGLGARDLTLPAGASLTPPVPVGEHWVTAPGASLENGVLMYVHGGGFTHRNPPLMNFLGWLTAAIMTALNTFDNPNAIKPVPDHPRGTIRQIPPAACR